MKWVADQAAFDAMLAEIEGAQTLAFDTEADSLHSYFDKVCLIQLSAVDDYVVDPLSGIDLARLGEILRDPARTKILHGADYDLRILNRDYGFTINSLVDTMICAQLLGYDGIGLAALLKRHFGLDLDKSHQKADWGRRPLSREMLDYAATDTRHLIRLAAILRAELEERGRWEWALEEFERLQTIRFREEEPNGEGFRKLKGINRMERRSLGVLARLHAWRDALARKADKPPFRIAGNDTLIDIAREMPDSRPSLARIRGMSPLVMNRYSSDILSIIGQVNSLPEEELPQKGETRTWVRDRELERRVERLKKVRDAVAIELGIDASVLAPKHVLTAIATCEPKVVTDLQQVEGMRRWQITVVGEALVAAVSGRRDVV
jgi:ribonuclease D